MGKSAHASTPEPKTFPRDPVFLTGQEMYTRFPIGEAVAMS